MQIEQYTIDAHNQSLLKEHRRRLDFITSTLPNAEAIIQKLVDFQVAIPSWAL
jgi:L-rhamnose isomerase / sugar isomerase